ncbi:MULTISPECIES: putative signal transducing protein [unclassified Agarivorans]|uniref:putative signal transducing protein n=1 Tax=unclassified Agarivorans TaxID=2636026 RepID=UPI003D7EC244
MEQWHVFYSAANLLEAKLLQGMLIKQGIDTRLDGEFAMAAAGELPVDVFQVTIRVALTNWDRAKQAVFDYEQQNGYDWACDQCGERNPSSFDFCWSCQCDKQ